MMNKNATTILKYLEATVSSFKTIPRRRYSFRFGTLGSEDNGVSIYPLPFARVDAMAVTLRQLERAAEPAEEHPDITARQGVPLLHQP